MQKMLTYHERKVFGRAANNFSSVAETMLGIMIICFHGGPKFISKIIPVAKLNASYLYDQVRVQQ